MYFLNRLILPACLGIILLSSCSTAYQANSFSGGYSEFKVTQDTFVVTFRGNGYTSSETVLKYILKRASEITLQNGFTHFSIMGSQDKTQHSLISNSYTDSQTNLYGYSNGASLKGSSSSSAFVSEITKPCLTINIKCYMNSPEGVESINANEYLIFNQ